MFGTADSKDDFARAVKVVESVLGALGLEPDACRVTTTDSSTAWSLLRGSAEVLIFLNPAARPEDANFLRVVSPIWRSTDAARDAEVFRKLLELNATELFGTAFGLLKSDVVLVSERVTKDLDRSEVEEILQNIGAAGDYFDDKLVEWFGGSRLTDVRTSESKKTN